MKMEFSKSKTIFVFLLSYVLPIVSLIYIFINRKKWIAQNIFFFSLFALTSFIEKIVVTFITRDFWIVVIFELIQFLIIMSFIIIKKRNSYS